MKDVLAQNIQIGTGSSEVNIKGPLTLPGIDNPTFGDVINRIMLFLVPLAAVLLFLVLVWGGFDYLFSQGDPAKVKSAGAKITTAVIGFVILISAFLLVKIVSFIFGIGDGLF